MFFVLSGNPARQQPAPREPSASSRLTARKPLDKSAFSDTLQAIHGPFPLQEALMLRLIFGGYCLALCAMFIGAAVQAEQPDPVAPAAIDNSVPLPTPRVIEIARANEEAYKQAMIDRMIDRTLQDIMPRPYLKQDYNHDGVLDLIRKEVDNKNYVYINTNTNENPIYEPGILYTKDEPDFIIKRPIQQPTASSAEAWVHLEEYKKFDVYIEENYYWANTPEIDEFFDLFEPRFELMEQTTLWSSKKSYDKKLRIEVTESGGCYGGTGGEGEAYLRFSNPLYMQGCEMAYREDNQWKFNNPGELGDNWFYMAIALHETNHAINPWPIAVRGWLGEGWSVYNRYNILSNYGDPLDINQETADYYIHMGTSAHTWDGFAYGGFGYITNNYHDTTSWNLEIQESRGYGITAHMFSMLRDDYNLDWNKFYSLLNNNLETLDRSYDLDPGFDSRYTDMVVIDLFGRAVDMNFEEIQTVFRYDGPDGPGWGVREWNTRFDCFKYNASSRRGNHANCNSL